MKKEKKKKGKKNSKEKTRINGGISYRNHLLTTRREPFAIVHQLW